MKFLKKIKDFICKILSAVHSFFSEEQKVVCVNERKGKRSEYQVMVDYSERPYRPRQNDYG